MSDNTAQISEAESGAQALPYVHKIGTKNFTFRPLNKCGKSTWRAFAALEDESLRPGSQALKLYELLEGVVAPAQRDALIAADIDIEVAGAIFAGWQEKQGPKAP
jgi:hypothetical protein